VALKEPESHAAKVERVYGRYRARLKTFFEKRWHRRPGKTEPEDLVQTVYEKLLKSPEAVSGAREPHKYIFGVARNVLSTESRRRSGEPRYHIDVDSVEFLDDAEMQRLLLGDDYDHDVGRVLARRAFLELSPELQLIFSLDYEGHSAKKISEMTGTNRHTVKEHLHKALDHMRKRCGDVPSKTLEP
jgi:RNA polymerase sigma factor (sigma-70 family)